MVPGRAPSGTGCHPALVPTPQTPRDSSPGALAATHPHSKSFCFLPAPASKRDMGIPGAAPSELPRAQDALFAVQVVVTVALGDTQPCHVCCPGTKQPGGGGKEEKKGNKASHSNRNSINQKLFSSRSTPPARAAGAETSMSRSQSCCQGKKPYLFPPIGISGSDSTEKKHVQNAQSLLKSAFCAQCFPIYTRIYALHRSHIASSTTCP